MKKIPTLFVRDPDDRKYVTRDVTPGCEWVLQGHGQASRKFDGTCVMYDNTHWWTRREIKPGDPAPDGWVEADHDDTTGKRVGWQPAERSGFAKYLAEAIDEGPLGSFDSGTYELCGPKINGNPEGFHRHVVVPHGAEHVHVPLTFSGLRDWLIRSDFEGIVWHHPDGRMAKLKRRDYPA